MKHTILNELKNTSHNLTINSPSKQNFKLYNDDENIAFLNSYTV